PRSRRLPNRIDSEVSWKDAEEAEARQQHPNQNLRVLRVLERSLSAEALAKAGRAVGRMRLDGIPTVF
ncbi:MAG: hypothetical protein JJU00_04175, partial [Opitutales bacterium]|nr:hypothetical protein [Opitutales bacterium]